LESIRVLAKIVVDDPLSDFVTNVTICNNRQNPVNPWNLRANDRIQCDLHDRFKETTGIFYSRHENEFQNLSTKELEDMGYDPSRDIKIKPLAQTLLAVQGEIGRMSQLPEVFENQKWYDETFKEAYLNADPRSIILGYKVHLCLKSPMERLEERAGNQIVYAIGTARNLVWALLIQGFLNDDKLSQLLEDFGSSLTRDFDFKEYLKNLASTRLLPIFRELLVGEPYRQKMEDERYEFLRTKEIFRKCMELADKRFKWSRKTFPFIGGV
jgi:hypothetical protein